MKPKIKQQWIDALRSGEYHQGTGYLKSSEGYCCLGVLCDLYAKEHQVSWTSSDVSPDLIKHWELDGESDFLPRSVMKWAGIYSTQPEVEYDPEDDEPYRIALAELNDDGYSFSTIAELIEKNL